MGKKILIVDDSTIMRRMIGAALKEAGHEVAGEARDGDSAIELYEALKPDLVTMDITMRGMDGFTAAGRILAGDRQAKIIFLSNLVQVEYVEKARELGAKGYMNKNSTAEILELIDRL